jgi:electron transfer flavoprotein beta subunit
MNILVCVKQVPDIEQPLCIDETSQTAVPFDSDAYRINRFDELAVEEAIRIKEALSNVTVDVLTVGPDRSKAALRRALGMGADRGVHLRTAAEACLSPFVIAGRIAAVADGAYDLILAGMMSEDMMQGMVGPLVAGLLDWPCATGVVRQRIRPEKKTVTVERETGTEDNDILELDLPAVLTIQLGINQPRYPSLSNLLRAKNSELRTIDTRRLGPIDSRQSTQRLSIPEKARTGSILQGSQKEKAERLLRILREKGFIN